MGGEEAGPADRRVPGWSRAAFRPWRATLRQQSGQVVRVPSPGRRTDEWYLWLEGSGSRWHRSAPSRRGFLLRGSGPASVWPRATPATLNRNPPRPERQTQTPAPSALSNLGVAPLLTARELLRDSLMCLLGGRQRGTGGNPCTRKLIHFPINHCHASAGAPPVHLFRSSEMPLQRTAVGAFKCETLPSTGDRMQLARGAITSFTDYPLEEHWKGTRCGV